MLCPHCGHHGSVEQIGFNNEYEVFYCSVCKQKYVAYPTGAGELSELVPFPNEVHRPHGEYHPPSP